MNVIKPITNNAQKLKQKEFEKRFQDFFSFKDSNDIPSHQVSQKIIKEIPLSNSKYDLPLQNKPLIDFQKNKENLHKNESFKAMAKDNCEKENIRFEAISNQIISNYFLFYFLLFFLFWLKKNFELENAFSMVKKNDKFHMETIPIGENLFKEEPSEIKGSMTSFFSMNLKCGLNLTNY